MNGERLNHYRNKLREIVERVGRTAAGLEEQVRSPVGGEAAGGMSNAPIHLADLGTEAFNQELDATLLENETYIRDEALAALKRIDAGTYGRCGHCGREIAPERLDALPYARYCAPCAARIQSGRAVNLNDGRPVEWLGRPRYEGLTASPDRVVGRDLGADPDDHHAAGTPGGGTFIGGLAGTNIGEGDPAGANLEEVMGSGSVDVEEDEDEPLAESGSVGGAVGGTPANKRAKGKSAGRTGKSKTKPTKPKARRSKRSKK